MKLAFILCFAVAALSFSAQAKEEKSTPLTRLDAATDRMLQGLDQNQTRQFAAIRDSHGIICAVQSVEKDLSAASLNCIKIPELARPVQSRLSDWKGEIDPILQEAQQRLDTMIGLQDFAKPAQARSYLKQVDDAVAYKARKIESIPIASPEDCEKMMKTMDDSERSLKKLLIENLDLDKPVARLEK